MKRRHTPTSYVLSATRWRPGGNAEPVSGFGRYSQPAIRQLGQARPALESFARWSGAGGSVHDLVQGFSGKKRLPSPRRE